MTPAKVFAVYGDAGNVGGGVLLGVFLDKEAALLAAKGRGSVESEGSDGDVRGAMAFETREGWYVVTDGPLQIGKMTPSHWKKTAYYDVFLDEVSVGGWRVGVMKVLRGRGLTLAAALAAVDCAPVTVGNSMPMDDALRLKKELEACGAVVRIEESQ